MLDCPVCGVPMPPIAVDFDTRASGGRDEGGRIVAVSMSPRIDAGWWSAVRAAHPSCVPAGAGRGGMTAAPQCRAETFHTSTGLSGQCTLPRGHVGDHSAGGSW
jgi:hypothetical protein